MDLGIGPFLVQEDVEEITGLSSAVLFHHRWKTSDGVKGFVSNQTRRKRNVVCENNGVGGVSILKQAELFQNQRRRKLSQAVQMLSGNTTKQKAIVAKDYYRHRMLSLIFGGLVQNCLEERDFEMSSTKIAEQHNLKSMQRQILVSWTYQTLCSPTARLHREKTNFMAYYFCAMVLLKKGINRLAANRDRYYLHKRTVLKASIGGRALSSAVNGRRMLQRWHEKTSRKTECSRRLLRGSPSNMALCGAALVALSTHSDRAQKCRDLEWRAKRFTGAKNQNQNGSCTCRLMSRQRALDKWISFTHKFSLRLLMGGLEREEDVIPHSRVLRAKSRHSLREWKSWSGQKWAQRHLSKKAARAGILSFSKKGKELAIYRLASLVLSRRIDGSGGRSGGGRSGSGRSIISDRSNSMCMSGSSISIWMNRIKGRRTIACDSHARENALRRGVLRWVRRLSRTLLQSHSNEVAMGYAHATSANSPYYDRNISTLYTSTSASAASASVPVSVAGVLVSGQKTVEGAGAGEGEEERVLVVQSPPVRAPDMSLPFPVVTMYSLTLAFRKSSKALSSWVSHVLTGRRVARRRSKLASLFCRGRSIRIVLEALRFNYLIARERRQRRLTSTDFFVGRRCGRVMERMSSRLIPAPAPAPVSAALVSTISEDFEEEEEGVKGEEKEEEEGAGGLTTAQLCSDSHKSLVLGRATLFWKFWREAQGLRGLSAFVERKRGMRMQWAQARSQHGQDMAALGARLWVAAAGESDSLKREQGDTAIMRKLWALWKARTGTSIAENRIAPSVVGQRVGQSGLGGLSGGDVVGGGGGGSTGLGTGTGYGYVRITPLGAPLGGMEKRVVQELAKYEQHQMSTDKADSVPVAENREHTDREDIEAPSTHRQQPRSGRGDYDANINATASVDANASNNANNGPTTPVPLHKVPPRTFNWDSPDSVAGLFSPSRGPFPVPPFPITQDNTHIHAGSDMDNNSIDSESYSISSRSTATAATHTSAESRQEKLALAREIIELVTELKGRLL